MMNEKIGLWILFGLGLIAMELIYRWFILEMNSTKDLETIKRNDKFKRVIQKYPFSIIGVLKIFAFACYFEMVGILSLIIMVLIKTFSNIKTGVITIIVIGLFCIIVYYNKKWTDKTYNKGD